MSTNNVLKRSLSHSVRAQIDTSGKFYLVEDLVGVSGEISKSKNLFLLDEIRIQFSTNHCCILCDKDLGLNDQRVLAHLSNQLVHKDYKVEAVEELSEEEETTLLELGRKWCERKKEQIEQRRQLLADTLTLDYDTSIKFMTDPIAFYARDYCRIRETGFRVYRLDPHFVAKSIQLTSTQLNTFKLNEVSKLSTSNASTKCTGVMHLENDVREIDSISIDEWFTQHPHDLNLQQNIVNDSTFLYSKLLAGKVVAECGMYVTPTDHTNYSLNAVTLLEQNLLSKVDLPGITTPAYDIGIQCSLVAIHTEDEDCQTLNLHRWGATKIWYVFPKECKLEITQKIAQWCDRVECANPTKHRDIIVAIENVFDDGNTIKYTRIQQEVGDVIVLDAGAYHMVINSGNVVTETINFATIDWLRQDRSTEIKCNCGESGHDITFPINHP